MIDIIRFSDWAFVSVPPERCKVKVEEASWPSIPIVTPLENSSVQQHVEFEWKIVSGQQNGKTDSVQNDEKEKKNHYKNKRDR